MADYKTPKQIADQYLLTLKTLKPEVNTAQTDSDWWIRGQVVGGVFAGVYADQKKVSNDAFPQSARREALEQHLETQFGEGFKAATPSIGTVLLSAATGSTCPAGTQLVYDPNGNIYATTESVVFSAATAAVAVQSINAGQDQNLLEGAVLSIPSPPFGVANTALVFDGNLSDGRNVETNEQAADRILTQIRSPLAGGKVADYKQFALDADPSVVQANVIRYPFGFGTVAVVITAGTTDIDEALENNIPIVLIPSDALVEKVQDYIETQNPITDCATVLKPASVGVDATVRVRFQQGDVDTVLSGQTLTQGELVAREVMRAIYKTPPGGRLFGSTGYVVASEIEETIDSNLSAEPYILGNIAQILVDRQLDALSATGPNLSLSANQVAFPGTITVVEM
jgi:uncharacterized phage protein gp47/JayE